MARDSRELQRILKASGKTTLNLPAIAGRETPQDEDQLAAVREVAEGQFDVLGEMGRGKKGSVVYLARDLSTQRLVALKLSHEGREDYTLEVVQQLDGTVPALEGACSRCGKPQEGWGRYCWNCGEQRLHRCPQCALPVLTGDRFCASCGAPQETEA